MAPMMTKTLAEAMKQVKELPDETQDRFAFDIIDRVAAWHEVREKIAAGARELDAGLGRPLSKKDLLAMLRKRHGKKN